MSTGQEQRVAELIARWAASLATTR
jgi:hypothetical protein